MHEEPATDGAPLRRFKDPAYVPLCSSLAEIRTHIDRLDREIVTLLAQRGRYVKDAARFKRDAFQVSAPQRQQQVFDHVRTLAEQAGAYPEVVEACYRAMVAGFIAREQADFNQMESIGEQP